MTSTGRPPKPLPLPFGMTLAAPTTTTEKKIIGGADTAPPTLAPRPNGEVAAAAAAEASALAPPNNSEGGKKDGDLALDARMRSDSENRQSVASESSSRQSLRNDVNRMRRSLTTSERSFLANLCQCGTESQVLVAHENLLNDGLFFPLDVSWGAERSKSLNLEDLSVSEAGYGDDNNNDNDNDNDLEDFDDNNNGATSPPPPNQEATSVGSEQRQKALEERKQNFLVGKLWKAHQNGLALSVEGSRRSLVRHASLTLDSSCSSSGGSSYQRRLDEIFRGRRASGNNGNSGGGNAGGGRARSNGSLTRALRQGNFLSRSDNARRVSFSSLRAPFGGGIGGKPRATSISSGLLPPPPPLPRPFGKPLRRMQSEGSVGARRVTFGELPIPPAAAAAKPLLDEDSALDEDEASSSAPSKQEQPSVPSSEHQQRLLQHRDSVSSIPSLHMAHPIRSPASSVVLSQGSLPAMSQSQASFPSLHLAHSVHDAASVNSPMSFRRRNSSLTMDGLDESVLGSPKDGDDDDDEMEARSSSTAMDEKKEEEAEDLSPSRRPVVLGDASVSSYQGVGIEVQESPDKGDVIPNIMVLHADEKALRLPAIKTGGAGSKDGNDLESRLESLVSFGEGGEYPHLALSSSSFDETMSHGRLSAIFRRGLRRSLSDADLAGIFLGGSRLLLRESSSVRDVNPDDSSSWVLDDEKEDESLDYYDAWKVIEDEYENGYGGGGTLPFRILGTSADDVDAHPHVLSPPLIESLQAFMPQGQAKSNVWMKFSLVRDGANLMTFLQHARGSRYTILALETVDGEVFGAFTTEAWRKNWNTFGGGESFLWRMRHSRNEKCHSIIDQAQKESIVDVYPYTGANNYIQFCTQDRIAVGGGSPSSEDDAPTKSVLSSHKHHEWGFGLSLSSDLLTGTSSPCITFGSPSLSTVHKDGSVFEIINLELWTLTPCTTVEEAEKLELGKLFLEANSNRKLYL